PDRRRTLTPLPAPSRSGSRRRFHPVGACAARPRARRTWRRSRPPLLPPAVVVGVRQGEQAQHVERGTVVTDLVPEPPLAVVCSFRWRHLVLAPPLGRLIGDHAGRVVAGDVVGPPARGRRSVAIDDKSPGSILHHAVDAVTPPHARGALHTGGAPPGRVP